MRYTLDVRALLLLVVACSASAPTASPKAKPRDAAVLVGDGGITAPGLRLPDDAAPLSYDLRLELDPDREDFGGHVAIRVKLAAPTDHLWIHANELELAKGTAAGAPIKFLDVPGAQEMIVLAFGKQLSGEITIEIDYAGHVGDDLEGLFRQKVGGKWYLYSQTEATYARRILPCFDEPRFKVPWRVTLSVPANQVALSNAPIASERTIDKRREVTFAEMPALPAHLFAVAVGPFSIVDIGKVGRAGVPARVVTTPKDAKRTAAAALWVPKLVDTLEQYFDRPLPLAKLDLVTVPRFFGAMENPGLIMFEYSALVGNEKDAPFLRRHIRFLAHELSHQWLGNATTPLWWDDLWLAEAFATWLDDKFSSALGQLDDGPLRTQLARAHALEADREIGSKPIRRTLTNNDEIEEAFDAISYEKGAAVIAMFEDFLGADKFRDVMRAYVSHTGNASAQDFLAVLAKADPALAKSFGGYLDHTGVPIVDITIDCPRVIAKPRDGATIPVCIRHPGGKACALAPTTFTLPSCPPWVVGNAEGRGYYHVQAASSPAPLTPAERIAFGEDRAAAVVRGEATTAQQDIDALAAQHDPYADLAALAIAAELDKVVTDRAAWTAHLASLFGDRMKHIWDARTPIDFALRDALVVIPAEKFPKETIAKARQLVESALDGNPIRSHELVLAVAIAAPSGGKALFDRIVTAMAKDPSYADEWFEGLGWFDGSLAPRAVALVLDNKPDRAWPAIGGMLERPASRVAAWRAVHPKVAQLVSVLGGTDAKLLLESVGALCDRTSRAEVAADLTPLADGIVDGKLYLANALATIDRCIKIAP